jgi:hypothetical protein
MKFSGKSEKDQVKIAKDVLAKVGLSDKLKSLRRSSRRTAAESGDCQSLDEQSEYSAMR